MTKIKLTFAIFGDLLNPRLFTELTKLSPNDFWFKGETVSNRKLGLTRKETSWEYSIGFVETLYFEELANLFIQDFSLKLNDIIKYIENNRLETKINIVVEIVNNRNPAISFDKKFIELVLKMNGEIDIDLYHTNE